LWRLLRVRDKIHIVVCSQYLGDQKGEQPMRRWNGWGSDRVDFPLTEGSKSFLAESLGPSEPGPSAKIEDLVRNVKPGRLSAHPLIDTNPLLRLTHARGQSLPDWIALRFGSTGCLPDGVTQPSSEDDVLQILQTGKKSGISLIPYRGGTSVVGHINPLDGDRPVLTVDMGRMFLMTRLDKTSRLAAFGAGVKGPHLEAQLRAEEFTLGHFPQSFEYSTLGGWIATRSSGQQSLYYGRIEDLYAGGTLLTPEGRLEFPPFPASAAGPDLRQSVLGSEGRLGFITQAVVRVSPLPEQENFHGIFFPDWSHGLAAVRELAQASVPLSMIRLSDPVETKTTLILAGRERIIRLLERLLRVRGVSEGKCLLLCAFTGTSHTVRKIRHNTLDIVRDHDGIHAGRQIGREWRRSRFRTPYLRNTLWDFGYAVDTLESVFTWDRLSDAASGIVSRLKTGLEDINEKVLAFAHVSHVYTTGASLYFTIIFRISKDREDTLDRWHRLKTAASREIQSHGGTISHQHGVGIDHYPYLEAEKGSLGIKAIEALSKTFDPDGLMNPGKLIQDKGIHS